MTDHASDSRANDQWGLGAGRIDVMTDRQLEKNKKLRSKKDRQITHVRVISRSFSFKGSGARART